jgi:threonine 3-dehydrogenase
MAYLVTTTNFIGRSLADLLASEGETVTLFGDPIEPRKLGPHAARIRLEHGDVADLNAVLDVVRSSRPAAIFHLGQLFAKPSEADPAQAFSVNVQGTYHVLEAARQFSVPKIVYFSTLGTFGQLEPPVLNHDSPQRPRGIYGTTKLIGELLGGAYGAQLGVDFRCIRFPPLFGPGADVDTFSSPLNRIVQEPALGRPYTVPGSPSAQVRGIYLKDARLAFVELCRAPAEEIKTRFYVLAGVTGEFDQLASLVRSLVPEARIGFQTEPRKGARELRQEAESTLVDESRAREEWGWRGAFTLESAVSDFVQELRSDPDRYA